MVFLFTLNHSRKFEFAKNKESLIMCDKSCKYCSPSVCSNKNAQSKARFADAVVGDKVIKNYSPTITLTYQGVIS